MPIHPWFYEGLYYFVIIIPHHISHSTFTVGPLVASFGSGLHLPFTRAFTRSFFHLFGGLRSGCCSAVSIRVAFCPNVLFVRFKVPCIYQIPAVLRGRPSISLVDVLRNACRSAVSNRKLFGPKGHLSYFKSSDLLVIFSTYLTHKMTHNET